MSATPATDTSVCPRCQSEFRCGVRSGDCWCSDVKLDPRVTANLVTFYDGCLCRDCLQTIADSTPDPPSVREVLKRRLRRRYGRSRNSEEQVPAPEPVPPTRVPSDGSE